MRPILLIIDGDALLHRIFHVQNESTMAQDGNYTGTINGSIFSIRKYINHWQAEYAVIAFDPFDKSTFRHKEYSDYKANRPPKDPSLVYQKKPLMSILYNLGLTVVMNPNYEADDLVGSYAKKAWDEGFQPVAMAVDKDLAPFTDQGLIMCDPKTLKTYNADGIRHRYKLDPSQINDYLALLGDSVDNIPGIDGVGAKTATELLTKYDNLDNIIRVAFEENLQTKVWRNIRESAEKVQAFKKMMVIRDNVSDLKDIRMLNIRDPQYDQLIPKLEFLGLFDLLNEAKLEYDKLRYSRLTLS